ncbi:hypothetical protein KKF55_05820 [Patescibacteria group bacterium]|nr:hypothetical protein [Patescibacteria group bacterium]
MTDAKGDHRPEWMEVADKALSAAAKYIEERKNDPEVIKLARQDSYAIICYS